MSMDLDIFRSIAEERIREDMEKGGFDNLPGKGRRLELEDDSMVPEDLRMAYKVLKNAGFAPPELEDRKELVTILDLLENSPDEQERYRQIRKLNVIIRRIQSQKNRPVTLEQYDEYYRRAVERLSLESMQQRRPKQDGST